MAPVDLHVLLVTTLILHPIDVWLVCHHALNVYQEPIVQLVRLVIPITVQPILVRVNVVWASTTTIHSLAASPVRFQDVECATPLLVFPASAQNMHITAMESSPSVLTLAAQVPIQTTHQ